ncbi:lymphocyte function-associated antigen 3 isoform X3 [Pelodiscus sinensis]|uniref:lymphocyte function-associated antigen 3 isoform X3 n=1 Tax=Pelodiscus sinensis TaxID=13735 RepID=UPI003F6D8B65
MGLGCRLSAVGLLLSTLQVCIWSQESVFAIVGEDVTLSPKLNGPIREIIWLKKKNKVAEWEGKGLPEYFSTLSTRGELETSSGNLTIKMLNTDDAAGYEVEFLLDDGTASFKRKQIVLEVLERPPPPVLNCSISNDRIKILCTKNFSKDVLYSWYLDGQIVNDVSSAVYESEKIPESSKTMECAISVSKTQIRSAISLSTCFQEPAVSPSRGRGALIAIFVVLVIVGGVLLCWWKRDWLRGIFGRTPTMHSGEGAKGNQPDQSRSEDDKGSHKEDENRTLLPEVEKNSQESKAVTTNDPPGNQENPDSENTKDPEEEKNSQELKAVTTNDPPGNQENPDSENTKDPACEFSAITEDSLVSR